MATEIATHDIPAWKDRANFLVFADLTESGMPGRLEQLWVRQLKEQEFEICCIPFFTYGLALGDTVHTRASGGKSYLVIKTLSKSGRRVLRLWLKAAHEEGRERLLEYLTRISPLHEWSSDNLLAIDVPADGPDASLSSLLKDLSYFGIESEWG